jgi:hypothetical protein
MMLNKLRLALAATLLALAAVSAVDSAWAFEQIVVEWGDQKDDERPAPARIVIRLARRPATSVSASV